MLKIKPNLIKIFNNRPADSIPRFSPPPTKSAAIWSLCGGRARDALPGGVSGMCHHRARFRANREILSPPRAHFGTFRLLLSIKLKKSKIKVDINFD